MKEENDRLVYMYVFGNGNKYVGQTNDLDKRMKEGFNGSYNDYVINTKNKHGILRIEILGRGLNQEEANECEIKYIENFNTLNIKCGGSNPKGLNMDKGGSMPPTLKGENHGMAILTHSQADEIKDRLRNGDPQPQIAEDYNISPYLVSFINTGGCWLDPDISYPINPNYRSLSKKGNNHCSWNKNKDIKMNIILWAFIKGNKRNITNQDILNKYNFNKHSKYVTHCKNGIAIGDINLEELRISADYLKLNYPNIIEDFF